MLQKYRRDFMLLLSLLFICLITYCILLFSSASQKRNEQEAIVVISCGPTELATYPLDSTLEQTLQTSYGTNTVHIENGTVEITCADCPDQYCVKHTPISNAAEPIVCLPHKLVVEIRYDSSSHREEALDGITQ